MAILEGAQREPRVKWIRAASGSTYLCPVAIAECIDALSEEDLKSICARESMHPEIN